MVIIYSFISTGRFSFVEVAQINGNIEMEVRIFSDGAGSVFIGGYLCNYNKKKNHIHRVCVKA
jgi:hypothetical protein